MGGFGAALGCTNNVFAPRAASKSIVTYRAASNRHDPNCRASDGDTADGSAAKRKSAKCQAADGKQAHGTAADGDQPYGKAAQRVPRPWRRRPTPANR